jgi:hypothetical protein
MIKLKSLIKENRGNNSNVLYHATFYPLVWEIQQDGLVPGGNQFRNFDWSNKEYVYLIDNPEEAIALVENSDNENVPEEWFGKIVCLSIDVSKLDKRLLFKDENYNVPEDDHHHKSYMYKGVIPPSAIVSWDVTEQNESKLKEAMFPKDFNRHDLGTCMSAAALATDYLLKKGISDFKVVEGWVSLYPDQEEEDWSSHTWLIIKGRIFDPTKKQWSQWGFDPNEVSYEKIKKEYTPEQYQELCRRYPDDSNHVDENMTYSELLKQVDNGRKERAKTVRTRSIPVSVDEGQESWNFRYKSNPTTTGKGFQGQVTFFKEVSNKENAADIPCKVDCGCPDFMYRFAYNDAAEDASQIGSDSLNRCINQKPQPAYDFGVGMCKHLVALGDYLKTSIQKTRRNNLFEAIGEVAKVKNFNIEIPD